MSKMDSEATTDSGSSSPSPPTQARPAFWGRFQFRIWHLLVLIVCFAGYFAIVTQLGYQTAQFRVIEYSQKYGIRTFEYQFTKPESEKQNAICRQTRDAVDFVIPELVGKDFSIRYRSRPFLWIDEQDERFMAMNLVDALAKEILAKRTPSILLDESEPKSMTFGRWYW